MIKQDFLLVQIEEPAKKLAKLLKKKETPGSNTDTLADDCYKDIHLSLQEVQNATAEELTEKVPDWELLELLVKLMLADDRINTDRQQIEKAQQLLYFVQERDRTYSFDRIALAESIRSLLTE